MVLQTFACHETSRERPSWPEEGSLSEARAGVWPAGGTRPGAREARAGAPGAGSAGARGSWAGPGKRRWAGGGLPAGTSLRPRGGGPCCALGGPRRWGRGGGRSEALSVPVWTCRGPPPLSGDKGAARRRMEARSRAARNAAGLKTFLWRDLGVLRQKRAEMEARQRGRGRRPSRAPGRSVLRALPGPPEPHVQAGGCGWISVGTGLAF